MRLIWTYDYGVYIDDLAHSKKIILLNYYFLSIQSAKKLGYKTIMYCTQNSVEYFQNLVDELHIVENKLNTPLYDYIKFQVLEEQEDDDYYLIDGDLILNFKLPIPTTDITFDAYEEHFNNTEHWSKDFEQSLDTLTNIGIGDYISEWKNEHILILNCGILNIRGKENRQMYVSKWKAYNSFIMKNISKLELRNLTNIGAQYLLTILCDYYNLSTTQMEVGFGKPGYHYTHYAGDEKYLFPIVPSDILLNFKNDKILI